VLRDDAVEAKEEVAFVLELDEFEVVDWMLVLVSLVVEVGSDGAFGVDISDILLDP
jgi:hypothetical protein